MTTALADRCRERLEHAVIWKPKPAAGEHWKSEPRPLRVPEKRDRCRSAARSDTSRPGPRQTNRRCHSSYRKRLYRNLGTLCDNRASYAPSRSKARSSFPLVSSCICIWGRCTFWISGFSLYESWRRCGRNCCSPHRHSNRRTSDDGQSRTISCRFAKEIRLAECKSLRFPLQSTSSPLHPFRRPNYSNGCTLGTGAGNRSVASECLPGCLKYLPVEPPPQRSARRQQRLRLLVGT